MMVPEYSTEGCCSTRMPPEDPYQRFGVSGCYEGCLEGLAGCVELIQHLVPHLTTRKLSVI